jgi:hypothetical protein
MRLARTDKPWGYERLLESTEHYAGKTLCIRAGQRLSLQHRMWKDETLVPCSLRRGGRQCDTPAEMRRASGPANWPPR